MGLTNVILKKIRNKIRNKLIILRLNIMNSINLP